MTCQIGNDGTKDVKIKNKSVEVKDCNIMTDGNFFLINQ